MKNSQAGRRFAIADRIAEKQLLMITFADVYSLMGATLTVYFSWVTPVTIHINAVFRLCSSK